MFKGKLVNVNAIVNMAQIVKKATCLMTITQYNSTVCVESEDPKSKTLWSGTKTHWSKTKTHRSKTKALWSKTKTHWSKTKTHRSKTYTKLSLS